MSASDWSELDGHEALVSELRANPPVAPERLRQRVLEGAPASRAPRSRKRRLVLVVVPLGFGAYLANQAVYFVGTDDQGFVTLYRGLPYALPAGIDLYKPTYVSGVPIATVPATRRRHLVDHTLRSRDDASDLIRALELGRVSS